MEIKSHFKHNDMEAQRSGWFTCSCCPTNITRLIPSIPGYMYALKSSALYINLFAKSTSTVTINNKQITITQENNYPWDGKLSFKIEPASTSAFNVLIRIPGWAQGHAMPSDLYSFAHVSSKKIPIFINGKEINYSIENGYAVLSKTWKKGDMINLELPMDVQKIISNEKIEENIGKVALQRGPIMYCAESPDNFGLTSNLIVPATSTFKVDYNSDLLNGIVVLTSDAIAISVDSERNSVSTKPQTLTAIPYYAWAHRGKGEMTMWFPQKVSAIEILSH